jgi:pimeloyl-ACP methyl ester carboxylesterase
MNPIAYRKVNVDGFNLFYREAGPKDAPTILLLHGFPSSGHMFRDLIPLLSDRFRLVAPDLPGFGQSDMPPRGQFTYTFENIAKVIARFTEVIGLERFAIYVFDYGAPTGFRLATMHPERITAIISQNGNAYEEGLSDGWNPIRAYWTEPSAANRQALRSMLQPATTVLAVHARRPRRDGALARRLLARQLLFGAAGRRRHPARPVRRLQEQRRALSDVSALFSRASAAVLGGVGQARSLLFAGGRRGVRARSAESGRALLRHRPLCARDARRRHRRSHSRLFETLKRRATMTTSSVAIVSGASQGIGQATALRLGARFYGRRIGGARSRASE